MALQGFIGTSWIYTNGTFFAQYGAGGEIFENEYSGLVNDRAQSERMWELSAAAVGLKA